MPSQPLLITKLHRPTPPADFVLRPLLMKTLDGALRHRHRLLLVSAPAGFGKTMLIAKWLEQGQRPAAWLSLGQEDNDPVLFWRYVTAALQTVDADLGQTAQAALEAPPPLLLDPILTTLINDLARRSRPLILVLDDYHLMDSGEIHSSLNHFLDHLPSPLLLAIITRADPPLALSRCRSLGQITEIRTADLRFSSSEAAVFLNTLHRLNLPDEDVKILENRTEGWLAGLQLAALSLRQQTDRHTFVQAFAGDDRYVMDYLLEEVLQQQPAQTQSFLLQTSILDRLCGPLCEAVTGFPDILHDLERANLFIVPLDNRRYWYRYHHLFADLLRRRLGQSMPLAEKLVLYRRASLWFEAQGLSIEAISQALAAPDYELSAELLERHALTLFFRSETRLVHRWLMALPKTVLRAHPLLCVTYAHTLAHTQFLQPGSLEAAEGWLSEAEQALAHSRRPTPADDVARCFIALSRAYLALWRHADPQTVIELALRALAILPPEQDSLADPNYLRFRSGLNNNLGLSYLILGDEKSASAALAEAQRIGEACDDHLNAYTAVRWRADLLARHGHLREAADLCQRALAGAGPHPAPYAAWVYLNLGQILLEWNDLAAAEAALVKGLELGQLAPIMGLRASGYGALACLYQARGEAENALRTLQQGESLDEKTPETLAIIALYRTRLWLMQGGLHAAAAWAEGRSLSPGGGWDEGLTLARVLIAQKLDRLAMSSAPDLAPLLACLTGWLATSEARGWMQRVIELGMLRALALYALGDSRNAADALRRALILAGPEGYTRMFVNEGEPMRRLLLGMKAEGGSLAPLINRLLAAWGEIQPSELPGEPVSQRELEVLRLMAAGASNAEIAQELVITVNTTKKHIGHILRKLDVSSRTKAVRRARELGLLE